MSLSIKGFGRRWLQFVERLVSRTTWKEDLIRGLELLKTGGESTVDRSFAEVELIRLRRHLAQVDDKLTLAFQALGKKCMDHWTNQQVLDEKEKSRAFSTIETLKREREQVLDQIAAMKTPTQHEVSSPSH